MSSKIETITLGGGCFWCLEAVYEKVQGVTAVESGYSNGKVARPTYEQVCSGETGAVEVVKVSYDPAVITLREILEIFFVIHDPTSLNRQGNDAGTQYRSAMYYANDEQKELFEAAAARAADIWDGRIVTEISPLGEYFDAEEYHQDFFAKNPNQGYCMAVAVPKVNKVRKGYAQYIKAA